MAKTLPVGNRSGLSELWARIRFVFLAILVYRIGAHIPVPYNPDKLAQLFGQNEGQSWSVQHVLRRSAGAYVCTGSGHHAVHLCIDYHAVDDIVSPQLEQLKKEGESGRRKISQYTRYGTVLLALIQGTGMTVGLANQGVAFSTDFSFYFVAVSTLVTGAVFMMWLGEQITERGIGNGISVLIFAGIVAGLPGAISQSFESARQGDVNILALLVVAILAAAVHCGFIERGQPYHGKLLPRATGRKVFAAQSSHLPLKVNMAGVIPAIFASSILLVPCFYCPMVWPGEGWGWLQDIALPWAAGSR